MRETRNGIWLRLHHSRVHRAHRAVHRAVHRGGGQREAHGEEAHFDGSALDRAIVVADRDDVHDAVRVPPR